MTLGLLKGNEAMKKDIHPESKRATIKCVCGNVLETRSTRGSYEVDVCANCHPFFTGKQKFVDTAGRVERFQRRYARFDAQKKVAETTAARPEPEAEPPAESKPAPGAAPESAPSNSADTDTEPTDDSSES
jgi:large subunit ribosomal protein L31